MPEAVSDLQEKLKISAFFNWKFSKEKKKKLDTMSVLETKTCSFKKLKKKMSNSKLLSTKQTMQEWWSN